MEFLSFEISKKLKEKGFKEECLGYYTKDSDFYYNTSYGSDVENAFKSFNSRPNNLCGKRIDAPTISQVLKWLREKKGMEVYSNYNRVYKHWTYIARAFNDCCYNSVGGFKSYEQAALAGIEYVLDNLI